MSRVLFAPRVTFVKRHVGQYYFNRLSFMVYFADRRFAGAGGDLMAGERQWLVRQRQPRLSEIEKLSLTWARSVTHPRKHVYPCGHVELT